MAAYNQPIETLPIFDNSVFVPVTTGSGGLSEAQADLLYLRKTVADTATALETFAGGIQSSFINPLTASSSLLVSSSTNTGTIVIDTGNTGNTDASPALSIGTSAVVKTIKIGSSAVTNSVHLASLDATAASLNNISGATGVVNVGSSQTSGILNIGNGSLRTAIGTINIGAGVGSLGPITIGSTSCKTTIASRLTGGVVLDDSTTVTSSFIGQGGTSLGWNYAAGQGESDIINFRGGGSGGGFYFYDQTTTPAILTPDLIMTVSRQLTGLPISTTLGGLYVNTLNVYSNIYLPTVSSIPVAGQLGYVARSFLSANLSIPSVIGTVYTILTLPLGVGIWQVSYETRFVSVGAGTFNFTMRQTYISMPTPIDTSYPLIYAQEQTTASAGVSLAANLNCSNTGSCVLSLNVAQTISLSGAVVGTPSGAASPYHQGGTTGSLSQTYIYAVRIA